MNLLIDTLRSFNSKERFFLVADLLGPQLSPSPDFRMKTKKQLQIELPEKVYFATDYHLDWLYASLRLVQGDGSRGPYGNLERLIKASQEDIDLLIAYEVATETHLLLIEAKGVDGFGNSQLTSKAERLRSIFGEAGRFWPGVIPHFALACPYEPSSRLRKEEWPEWMKLHDNSIGWLPLELPEHLNQVERCRDCGTVDEKGDCWKVSQRKVSGVSRKSSRATEKV